MADSLTKAFQSRIAACKNHKRDLVPDWVISRDYRRGKPFPEASDNDRIAVNIDAPFTKAKQATLFSQVPQVVVTPKHPQFAAAAPVFGKVLNDTLTKSKVGVAMDECLPDMINMSGVAGVIIAYEALEEPAEVPALDPALLPPDQQMAIMTGAVQIPMLKTKRTTDSRIVISHVEPEDLLWPVEFKGSDFNDSPWVGRTGRLTWEAAKRTYSLKDEQKPKVLGEDRPIAETTSDEPERKAQEDTEIVTFDEIFYWRHHYHEDEKSFSAIQHMVFITGLDEPVVNEPWKGQQVDEATGSYLGSCLPPVQFCTLTHISGEAIPPSDSAISRPQVDELNQSRTDITRQRKYSLPVRWGDVNRIDATTLQNMQRGEWQNIIPVNGDGSRALGEVARAQYPQENLVADRMAKEDMQNQWGLGNNQLGNFASGERSASEAAIIQSNNQTRVGQERAKVVDFFLRIAQVTAGLLALYGDWDTDPQLAAMIGPDGAQRLQSWKREAISQEFAFSVRADSSVLLDSEQRLARLTRLLNFVAKAPGVNSKPILEEIVSLSGMDPALIVGDPPAAPPQEIPALSLKGEDLLNPIALATLMRFGCAPGVKELTAAVELLKAASGMPGGDMPGGEPAPASPNAPPPPANNPPTSPEPPPEDFDAQPNWTMANRINTRREDQI